jgi:ubiquinol-cytochrome c reductase iron-sulfur subunit
MASESELNAGIEDGVRRRDFINIAAVSFAGVGAVAVVLPLLNQMNPSADVLALSTTEIDISAIQPGQAIKTSWRKQPVFVRNLVAKEIAEAKAVPLGDLRDPETIDQRTKPGKENWLITLGVCTHLGCVPLGAAEARTRAISAVISARATVRITTPRRASVRARHPRIWLCRPMNSTATPS